MTNFSNEISVKHLQDSQLSLYLNWYLSKMKERRKIITILQNKPCKLKKNVKTESDQGCVVKLFVFLLSAKLVRTVDGTQVLRKGVQTKKKSAWCV